MKSWRQRIDEAKQAGTFTQEDKELASHWPSCAIGERRGNKKDYPYWDTTEEHELGNDFDLYVMYDDVKLVERIYEQIQRLPKAESIADQKRQKP